MKLLQAALFAMLVIALHPPSARAQPPQPQGEPVWADDFSDASTSGLEDNVNATDYSRGFHAPGVYHLRLERPNDTRMALIPGRTFGASTLELDLWDNSDDFAGDAALGVVFHAQDQSHLYAVLLNPRKGHYAVRKLDGSVWSDIVAWKDSALIKQNGGVNHLRVDADDDTFTLYLQDQQLDRFSDASFGHGAIGIIASNVDAVKPHMHFDNLKVFAAAADPAPVAAMLPNTGRPATLLWPAALALALLGGGVVLRRRHTKALLA